LMVAIRREALPFFERAYEVIIPGFKERGQLMDPIVFGPYCSYKGERLNKDMEKNDVFATEVVGFLVKTAKEIKPESLTDESSETELRSRQEQLLAELEGFIIRRKSERGKSEGYKSKKRLLFKAVFLVIHIKSCNFTGGVN